MVIVPALSLCPCSGIRAHRVVRSLFFRLPDKVELLHQALAGIPECGLTYPAFLASLLPGAEEDTAGPLRVALVLVVERAEHVIDGLHLWRGCFRLLGCILRRLAGFDVRSGVIGVVIEGHGLHLEGEGPELYP